MESLKTFFLALLFISVPLGFGYGVLLAIAAISGRVRPEWLQLIGLVFIVLAVGFAIRRAIEND